jgi:hypothetical protein
MLVLPKVHDKGPLAAQAAQLQTGGLRRKSVSAVAVSSEAEVEAGLHDVFGFIDAVDESKPIILHESEVAMRARRWISRRQ